MAYGRNEFGYYDEYQAVASSNQGSFNNPRQKCGWYKDEVKLDGG